MVKLGNTGTPLIKKLGIKDEHALLLLNIPDGINHYWKLIEKDCRDQLCVAKQLLIYSSLCYISKRILAILF